MLGTVDQPWKACFSSSEPYDLEAIRAGNKLPCFYSRTQWGTVDYWEEHACEEVFKSNCYCFALNRYIGEFCQPGAVTIQTELEIPLDTCEWNVKAVLADGALPVNRETIYSKQPKGHYIALAVSPREDDYHFWRLDSDGSWASKPGGYLPRRTYGSNNAKVTDVEDPAVRGQYTDFCGYFEVFPETHVIAGTGLGMPFGVMARFQAWSEAGLQIASHPLNRISSGWRLAFKKFWQTSKSDTVADGDSEGYRRQLRLQSMGRRLVHSRAQRANIGA